jgi:hypothetical protein
MVRKRLLVAIESAVAFKEKQTLCRNGWIKRFAHKHSDVDIFFVVGNGWERVHRDENDIVHVPAVDLYEWLPQKTYHLLKYAVDNYDFDYLYKCDDDTFVHLDRLCDAMYGHDYVGAVRKWIAGDGTYYAEGGAGYLLSRSAVQLAYDNFNLPEPPCGCEDVFVALALKRAGITPMPDSRFNQHEKVVPAKDNDQISCHYIKTQEQVDAIIAGLEVRDV